MYSSDISLSLTERPPFLEWIIQQKHLIPQASLSTLKFCAHVLNDRDFPSGSGREIFNYLQWRRAGEAYLLAFVALYSVFERETYGTDTITKILKRCPNCNDILRPSDLFGCSDCAFASFSRGNCYESSDITEDSTET